MFSFFYRRDITYPRGFQGFFCLQVLQVLWKNYKNIYISGISKNCFWPGTGPIK